MDLRDSDRPNSLLRIPPASGASTYWPTNEDFVEVWRFDMASGDLISTNLSETYTRQENTTLPTYEVAGPASTDLVAVEHLSGTKWQYAAEVPELAPGTSSFSISFVTKNDTDYDWAIIDYDSISRSTAGFHALKLGTVFQITVKDGVNTHHTHWTDADGASALEDGDWHHVKLIIDKSQVAVGVELDGVAQTTAKSSGSDLSAVGSVVQSFANGVAIGGQAYNSSRKLNNGHLISYVAVAHNITATTPLLP